MANLGLLSFVATNEDHIETQLINNKIKYSSSKESMIVAMEEKIEVFCTKDKSTKVGICKEYMHGLEKKSFVHNNLIINGIKLEMYEENEAIKFLAEYNDGIYDGSVKYFRENGTLCSSGIYVKGKLQGPCSVYDECGVKIKDVHYYNDLVYMINEYYPCGEIKNTYDVRHNKIHGIFNSFYKNGTLKNSVSYSNDKPHGLESNYSEYGNLISEINYYEGVKHGSSSYYDSTGNLLDIYLYQNGNIVNF
jgi:antitoxin component YwqK of YwqJK toxin-antitoxin module